MSQDNLTITTFNNAMTSQVLDMQRIYKGHWRKLKFRLRDATIVAAIIVEFSEYSGEYSLIDPPQAPLSSAQ